jgi:hypothetical protein
MEDLMLDWLSANWFQLLVIYFLLAIMENLKALNKQRSAWDIVLFDRDGSISLWDINQVRKTIGLEERELNKQ